MTETAENIEQFPTTEQTDDLLYIQANLVAPKGQFNDFGKFAYRSQEDILTALKPLLDERGCTLQLDDEVIVKGKGEKARFYVKATAYLKDSKGMMHRATGLAREPEEKKGMDSSQITGTASSYARKYALNGLFLIDDTKDADSIANITEDEMMAFTDLVDNDNGVALYAMQINDYEKFAGLRRKCAPKGAKTKFVNKVNQLILDKVEWAKEAAGRLIELAENKDKLGIQEITEELERDDKTIIWRQLNDAQKSDIHSVLSA